MSKIECPGSAGHGIQPGCIRCGGTGYVIVCADCKIEFPSNKAGHVCMASDLKLPGGRAQGGRMMRQDRELYLKGFEAAATGELMPEHLEGTRYAAGHDHGAAARACAEAEAERRPLLMAEDLLEDYERGAFAPVVHRLRATRPLVAAMICVDFYRATIGQARGDFVDRLRRWQEPSL